MSPHSAPQAAAALLHRIGATVHAVPVPGPAGTIEVGRIGLLPCWSAELKLTEASLIARRLAHRGDIGLLMVKERHGARQLLCVTLPPVRVMVLPCDDANHLSLLRLGRVDAASSSLGTAMACAAALDVDAAGRRAFRALRTGIDGAVRELPTTISPAARHAWVVLQVSRLLFLRFVESEGWLDGRHDFLAQEFDHCLARRGHPERHLLAPLFFGSLNRPIQQRSRRAAAFGAIPFLNGGLFEPHPIERRRRWSLPVASWQALFALIVESFEVTLDRGDVGDRVSPELLGRVFEGVMAPAERKAAGTFYTPTALVATVLRETLSSHLAHRLGRSEELVERALDDRDPALDRALLSLRILDPAVGSGAFLVGALGLICDAAHTSPTRTRHVITRRLFGVDRNPTAVRLTELRLWLELLRGMRHCPVARLAPLPNLDAAIRAGNALLDPFAGLRLPPLVSRRLAVARRHSITCHGGERRGAITALRRMERRAASIALGQRAKVLRETIADLVDQARTTDLFGVPGPLHSETRLRIAALRRELHGVRRERQRLRLHGAAPAFGIEAAFAPVLARGGFDLVVGNPPWVRGDHLPPGDRAALAARYRWWRGSGTGWRHAPDLAVAFLERSLELLAPHGTMGCLVPSKLATASYAISCRAALVHQATVHVAADLGRDPRANFEATTYPLALIASKRRPERTHRVRLDLVRQATTAQVDWQEAGTWSLASPAVQLLARRLIPLPTLADSCTPSLGVKTGANKAFLDPPAGLQRWTRPAIRGRDVRALVAAPASQLLWPADSHGAPWTTLPEALQVHLALHRRTLEQRSDLKGGAWWQLFRVGPATQRWRVVWSDLAPTLRAAPLADSSPVPLNSCYVAAVHNETAMFALAAWLNGTAIGALARSVAEPAANDHARFAARAVGAVPLPTGILADRQLAHLGRANWCVEVATAIDRHITTWLRLTDQELEAIDALGTIGR